MRFGDYMKNKRRQKNITQEDLARALGVSSVFVHQLETAKVDAPSLERCNQIADVLEVSIDEIWNVAKKERLRRFMEREGITEDHFEVLTEGERTLIKLYRSLDEDSRRDFGGMVYMLLRRSQDEGVQQILEEFMKCA
ncbi:MAG TPA: helix-turn-helix transcriptional regulator [Thermodesulfobacteriota bacterium]|jgi:transcriptional regulator with XRE-family HTH domain